MNTQDLEKMSVKEWWELINSRTATPQFKCLKFGVIPRNADQKKIIELLSGKDTTIEEIKLKIEAEEIENNRQDFVRDMEVKLKDLISKRNELERKLAQLVIEVYVKDDAGKTANLLIIHREIRDCNDAENDMKLAMQLMNNLSNSKLLHIDEQIARLIV